MVVVSNSSPLIALADIGQLDLLAAIFSTVLVPPAVVTEIAPSIPNVRGRRPPRSAGSRFGRPAASPSRPRLRRSITAQSVCGVRLAVRQKQRRLAT